jgi:catechol 2,3-dioxygenase-like lactoylglutathione lyase family enzyme
MPSAETTTLAVRNTQLGSMKSDGVDASRTSELGPCVTDLRRHVQPNLSGEPITRRSPMPTNEMVNVRYMVNDVDESIAFYTELLDFEILTSAAPAFADVKRANLRLLLSGQASSAGKPMPDGTKPGPGGWNRIHFIVDDIDAEVTRLRSAGATFRNDIVEGPGGRQILLQDPSGNVIELFQPATR